MSEGDTIDYRGCRIAFHQLDSSWYLSVSTMRGDPIEENTRNSYKEAVAYGKYIVDGYIEHGRKPPYFRLKEGKIEFGWFE